MSEFSLINRQQEMYIRLTTIISTQILFKHDKSLEFWVSRYTPRIRE